MQESPFKSMVRQRAEPNRGGGDNFDQLEAMELYCKDCGQAVPVTKKLLLVLPEGDKYEYCCRFCRSRVGDKIDRSGNLPGIIIP